eukprot:XP_001692019.1 predicted protein [Chlamydomonas reinhardtii]
MVEVEVLPPSVPAVICFVLALTVGPRVAAVTVFAILAATFAFSSAGAGIQAPLAERTLAARGDQGGGTPVDTPTAGSPRSGAPHMPALRQRRAAAEPAPAAATGAWAPGALGAGQWPFAAAAMADAGSGTEGMGASAAPSSPSDTSAAPPPGSAAGAADAAAANHLSRLLPDFSVGEGGGQEQPLQLWRGGRQQPGASAALTEVVGVTGGGNTASGNATRCTTTWSSLPLFCFAEVLSWMEDDCDRRRLRLCVRVTDAGVLALTALTGLTSLDLCGCCGVSDVGVMLLARLPLLQGLQLAWCVKVSNAGLRGLAVLPRLSHLSVAGCPLVSEAGVAGLSTLSRLACLDLTHLGITQQRATVTDAALSALCGGGTPGTAGPFRTRASGPAAAAAAAALQAQGSLLSGVAAGMAPPLSGASQLDDGGVGALAAALTGLRTLLLARCGRLTDGAALALAAAPALTTGLQWLCVLVGLWVCWVLFVQSAVDLSHCPRIGDAALVALARLPLLASLKLSGCAVEKLTQEVGGVKDQLAALSKVAREEVRWGRVRSALQELRAAECPYGRGGDCYLGTTREMLEWALRHMLRPGRFHIDLHDFYCELWAKESGEKPHHFYGRRKLGPADKVMREQLLAELVALTGLHLMVVSYDQQSSYIEESTEQPSKTPTFQQPSASDNEPMASELQQRARAAVGSNHLEDAVAHALAHAAHAELEGLTGLRFRAEP